MTKTMVKIINFSLQLFHEFLHLLLTAVATTSQPLPQSTSTSLRYVTPSPLQSLPTGGMRWVWNIFVVALIALLLYTEAESSHYIACSSSWFFFLFHIPFWEYSHSHSRSPTSHAHGGNEGFLLSFSNPCQHQFPTPKGQCLLWGFSGLVVSTTLPFQFLKKKMSRAK